jgi:hypothetical protein
MDYHIFVAIIGALVNMLLSVTIPCLLKKSDQPFLNDMKKVFQTNREVIIASSLIVAITIYLALKVSPEIELALSDTSDYFMGPSNKPGLINLSKLGNLNDSTSIQAYLV